MADHSIQQSRQPNRLRIGRLYQSHWLYTARYHPQELPIPSRKIHRSVSLTPLESSNRRKSRIRGTFAQLPEDWGTVLESPLCWCVLQWNTSDAKANRATAPLFNAEGKVVFFLGGQINCSTTIHSRSDILRVLSWSDKNEVESVAADLGVAPPHPVTNSGRKGFFKAFRSRSATKVPTVNNNDIREVGMEQDLINKIQKVNFKNQMKMFYTAYSKVLLSHPFQAILWPKLHSQRPYPR